MSESLWNDPRITAYALGELSGSEQAAFEQEMTADPQMAAAVAEARVVTDQLADLLAGESTPPLDESRRQSILAPAVNRAPNPARSSSSPADVAKPATRPRTAWRLPLAIVATAATLLLLVGIAPRVSQQLSRLLESPQLDQTVHEATVEPSSIPAAAPSAIADKSAVMESSGQPSELSPARSARSLNWGESDDEIGADLGGGMPSRREPFAIAESVAASQSEETPPAAPAESMQLDFQQQAGQQQAGTARFGQASQTERTSRNALRARTSSELSSLSARGQAPSVTPLPSLVRGENVDFGGTNPEGRGPGQPGDQHDPIIDNPFRRVSEHPLSTFSIDVDTASYSKTRDYLLRAHQLPRKDVVRIEEFLNYFPYQYQPPAPEDEHPFAAHAMVTECPWNPQHRLARIAIKGMEPAAEQRPRCNLVFLIDTSGSMDAPNKLPLVQQGLRMLVERLHEDDRVAIVVYAGSAGLVLDSTPVGNGQAIRNALTRLAAGGSTNGGAGISLAYQTARDNFIVDGVNRVILCSDGDFNVGTTGTDALVRMVRQEAQSGIFLSVLGFGMGNHNDAMLEKISGEGNGNYAFIDSEQEARKVLVNQSQGTLITIAKDVKLQLEFNPSLVSAYRLIGYENRVLAKEDFNDDRKDAGEIGAGHTVTALYEIVPTGVEADAIRPPVDPLRYQATATPTATADNGELLTLKLRYKPPQGNTSTLVEFPVSDMGEPFAEADADLRFAAAVAGFGMQLRHSDYRGSWTMSDVLRVAQEALGPDPYGLRAEFLQLVRRASELVGQER